MTNIWNFEFKDMKIVATPMQPEFQMAMDIKIKELSNVISRVEEKYIFSRLPLDVLLKMENLIQQEKNNRGIK